ncbi:MAG: hypothetical protein NT022_04945 [Deltaproteobacteria bacterium]|nr:hypothetical protein [Deltaproteobacteria bacterium]
MRKKGPMVIMKSRKKPKSATADKNIRTTTPSIVEETIEKKLEDLATLLCSTGEEKKGKSRVYEEVLAVVERCLFRIALRRNGNVKITAANYLGINRNTFQKKMTKMGMKCEKKS